MGTEEELSVVYREVPTAALIEQSHTHWGGGMTWHTQPSPPLPLQGGKEGECHDVPRTHATNWWSIGSSRFGA